MQMRSRIQISKTQRKSNLSWLNVNHTPGIRVGARYNRVPGLLDNRVTQRAEYQGALINLNETADASIATRPVGQRPVADVEYGASG